MSEVEPAAGLALPGEPCRVPPHENWSELEKWVWHEVGSGRIADINTKLGKAADPRKPEDWGPERRLSSAFLESILLHDPWRSAIPRHGVRILGAWFAQELDLQEVDIAHRLSIEGSRFDADVNLSGATIRRDLVLAGTTVTGALNLNTASIGGDLLMGSAPEHRAELYDVLLCGVQVGGQVAVTGAKVAGTLNMDSVEIGQSLFMRSAPEHRAEFNDVLLRGARIGGAVELAGTAITGALDLHAADIGGDLLMRSAPKHRAEFSDVLLRAARIDRTVELAGTTITGALNLNAASIGGGLRMGSVPEHRAEFNDMLLDEVEVGGPVSLIGAKVAGMLRMDNANIGGHLLMRSDPEHRTELNAVVLAGIKVGGQVSLVGAKVAGRLRMEKIDVGQHLLMRSDFRAVLYTEFDQHISLIFSRIGGGLTLKGAALSKFDLTATRIEGELTVASPSWSPRWRDGARLVLRNTSVGAIGDTTEEGVWPKELDLGGFAYGRLGGIDGDPDVDVAARGSKWFVDWLARDRPYSPQPYYQCAEVLRGMGHPEMANDVLYAGRERHRREAWQSAKGVRSYARTAGLWLLKSTVGYGYGYRYFRALEWILLFILVGVAVLLLFSGADKVAGTIAWSGGGVFSHLLALALYSFDLLLPIIELHKPHYDIVLDGVTRYYFAFHKLMGYALASFLIAGLAGLTK